MLMKISFGIYLIFQCFCIYDIVRLIQGNTNGDIPITEAAASMLLVSVISFGVTLLAFWYIKSVKRRIPRI